MNPAIDNFHVIARQVDALMKVSEFGRVLTLIYRLARRTQQEEGPGVEDVGDLLHEEESGQGFLAVGLALRASNASGSVVDFLRPGWHRML